MRSLFVDVNKIHNFNNITDFEQYSHLQYIDICDFDAFLKNNEYNLLSDNDSYNIHFEDEQNNTYSVRINDSMTVHQFTFFTEKSKRQINDEGSIKIGDSYLSYLFNHDTDEYQFIATHQDFKYRVDFKDNNNLSDSQLLEKIQGYVSYNNELIDSGYK